MSTKKEKVKITKLEDLPDTLTAQHIADFLSISRTTIYELFNIYPEHGGIPNYGIGISKRVDLPDFIEWIKARKQARINEIEERKGA